MMRSKFLGECGIVRATLHTDRNLFDLGASIGSLVLATRLLMKLED